MWNQAEFSRINLIVGLAAVLVTAVSGQVLAQGGDPVGPDIVTYRVYEPLNYGVVGDQTAYAVGTESCNRGDEPASWYSSNNQHPVIAQNLYRLKDGRLEQIGMSWLKHGFLSLNQDECDTCDYPPDGGSQLGVGCSDPYWASLNGSQDRLGPRYEVNAFTGEFAYPHSNPTGDSTLKGRLVVRVQDVDPAFNSGAKYFAEGQYVAPDEAMAGNSENSASYREQIVDDGIELIDFGDTFEGIPAIYAWEAADPTVSTVQVRVPDEGLFIVAAKTVDNQDLDGTWRYEYAVLNLNSHRSAQLFEVPIMPGTVVTNVGFHDVNHHSGEPYDTDDWTVTVDIGQGTVRWFTDAFDVDEYANALRWGTMYNFWFDANKPPQQGPASIGLFRPGTPGSVPVVVPAPVVGGLIFIDGFESGNLSSWS